MMAENEKIYWIQVALERLSVIAVNEKEWNESLPRLCKSHLKQGLVDAYIIPVLGSLMIAIGWRPAWDTW